MTIAVFLYITFLLLRLDVMILDYMMKGHIQPMLSLCLDLVGYFRENDNLMGA